MADMLFPSEQAVICRLIALARGTFLALEDSEEFEGDHGRCHSISGQDFDALDAALEALDELPDDRPGCTMSPADKAEWALQRLLGDAALAQQFASTLERLLAWESACELLERAWTALWKQERQIMRLEAALANRENVAWSPVDSAPKDRQILLMRMPCGSMANGFWLQEACDGAGAWVWPYIHKTPTHYMPLPTCA